MNAPLSVFDPISFMNQESTAGVDIRPMVHKAGDFLGYIGDNSDTENGDIVFRDASWTDKETGEQRTQKVLRINLYTDDPKARPEGLPEQQKPRVRWEAFIDLTPDGKSFDFGKNEKGYEKNKQLSFMLYALGFQDKEGHNLKPWSIAKFYRLPLRYRVIHSPRKDTGEPQAEVAQVARAS
jgi:hypothetical protein